MKQEQKSPNVRFTTMFDLYGLPNDFPGYKFAQTCNDPYAKVDGLEKEMCEDIRQTTSDDRFIPYIQLHEYEALLFSDIRQLGSEFLKRDREIEQLVQSVRQIASPELINDDPQKAPSKRIIDFIPEYDGRKASSGPRIAGRIGIDSLRQKCPHFDAWVSKLLSLPSSQASLSL